VSTRCDVCQATVSQDDGWARLSIFDPAPDFSSPAILPPPRRPPQLDLCAACLVRAIELLGLPRDTFVPRPAPAAPPPAAGALTPGDLVALGLVGKEDEHDEDDEDDEGHEA
jgi:hypothetical protein